LNPKNSSRRCSTRPARPPRWPRKQLDALQKLASLKLEVRAEPAPAETRGVKRSTTEFDLVCCSLAGEIEVLRNGLKREIEQYGKADRHWPAPACDPKFLAARPSTSSIPSAQKLGGVRSQLEKEQPGSRGLP